MNDTPGILKVVPPIWFLLFLALGALVHSFVPASHVFEAPYRIAGAILIIGSVILTQYAAALFSKEKTEILPSSPTNRVLIVRGPFKYSRNPMYLGMVLTLLGVAIYLGTLPMFVAALAEFLVLNFIFIPFEEKKMLRIFGEQYQAYKKKVRRWL